MLSPVTEDELQRLYRKFKKIDTDGSGTLSKEEFLEIKELQGNPLLERVIDVFDENQDGEVQFTEFISSLAVFSQNGNDDAKLRFAFQIYDIDRDGFISNGELFMVLKKMVGNNLTNEQLQQIVDKTIMEADKDGDGKISFDEFVQMLADRESITKKLSIDFSEDFDDYDEEESEED
eukprot:CAMPEP_0206206962 /NCGR_PEP_ID=MMETSP0166-20121206/15299_1 /ASSEMBLY_ACC=CAM_ASM_000260 /TAXON_ID=95228 /ORGANISM="Vannella robusta, Strain DIVA3 518/3/11/1/6" /LENGTH=176 /DNA_ID=CAMNT_0053627615 /DNA_START=39 /DNA_END=570 /DNA_ORIENTATION=-